MALEKENNPWKKSEDEILKMGIMKYGINKWNKISSLLKRTPLECRERYYNYILVDDDWTEEDLNNLIEVSTHLKPQWGLISKILNKSEQNCYEKYLNTVYKQIDVSKHDELREPTDEYDDSQVECALNQVKMNKKRKYKKQKEKKS